MLNHAVRLAAGLTVASLTGCATNSPADGPEASRGMAPQVVVDAHVLPDARGVLAPRRISGNAPNYPMDSLMRGGAGDAVIEFTVTEAGETADFVVVSASSAGFARNSIAALKTWRFEPAHKEGRPVPYRVRQPFSYTMR
jgi:protein TonB